MNKFYKVMKVIFGGLYKCIYRVKIINKDKEVFDKPFIVCANHTSMMDGPVVTVGLKNQIRCMSKKEVFKIPLVGLFLKSMGAFPIDRTKGDIAAVRQTLDILKSGSCIAVFPQGTRMPYVHPRDAAIKSGIGMFADRAGVGILPVCIKTKKNKVRIFRRTKFIIGDYIPPEDLKFEGVLGRDRFQKIAEYAFSKVTELYEEEERREKAKKEKKKKK